MTQTLQKLSPHRDLQCYFLLPSAIAAMSQASATGYTLSGTWRQQFDWAVVEWNRDNAFEHPMLRNLPDGDLSGVHLSYEETRENCIPLDSSLFHTVDWPSLRIWAESGGAETIYFVPLKEHATVIAGSYTPASAVFTLQGSPTATDYVEVAWLSEHYTYQLNGSDTLETAVQALATAIHDFSPTVDASSSGADLTLTYLGESATPGTRETLANSTTGANGNRLGAYVNVSGAQTETWSPACVYFSGGTSPSKWGISLNFGSLTGFLTSTPGPGDTQVAVPTSSIRKLRWTYSADFQPGAFQRSEYQVVASNWSVTGTNLGYQVAGSQSRRVEDTSLDLVYTNTGAWRQSTPQNFSGGTIHYTTTPGASVAFTYTAAQAHSVDVGTRRADIAAQISITVDGQAAQIENLLLGEDVLVRILAGQLSGGTQHTITVTHSGSNGSYFYFDFFEIAVPVADLPVIAPDPKLTLATDWDTYHSNALPAERTAWLIDTLGFTGRANHYVGALWFYELVTQSFGFASGTVAFSGTPAFGGPITQLVLGLSGSQTTLQHVNLIGDTAESIAKAFELVLNNGFTGIRAQASGAVLTIYSKSIGSDGNTITLSASPTTGSFQAQASGTSFTGGADGNWRTDLSAMPRINRAARDWSVAYFEALKSYGIDVAAAFSMELQHGDPDPTVGIAQRYHDGSAVQLTTPALQTNFSPASAAFWQQVHLDMANLMSQAGVVPYLQFGEVQWWYFTWDQNPQTPHNSLPFYDAYTTSTFSATYGRPMHVFANTSEDPAPFSDESQFLPGLIGAFTDQIMSFVRQTHANARFEVLYPPDTNDSPLDRVINLPSQWTPATLDCLKTENFTFTNQRDMNAAKNSILLPMQFSFPATKASHLIGIGDYSSPWPREVRMSKAEGVESVVLFALDQFCLIGYAAPLPRSRRRSRFMGQ
jgi:hypothetical protein